MGEISKESFTKFLPFLTINKSWYLHRLFGLAEFGIRFDIDLVWTTVKNFNTLPVL